jgi:hypothetical protein
LKKIAKVFNLSKKLIMHHTIIHHQSGEVQDPTSKKSGTKKISKMSKPEDINSQSVNLNHANGGHHSDPTTGESGRTRVATYTLAHLRVASFRSMKKMVAQRKWGERLRGNAVRKIKENAFIAVVNEPKAC